MNNRLKKIKTLSSVLHLVPLAGFICLFLVSLLLFISPKLMLTICAIFSFSCVGVISYMERLLDKLKNPTLDEFEKFLLDNKIAVFTYTPFLISTDPPTDNEIINKSFTVNEVAEFIYTGRKDVFVIEQIFADTGKDWKLLVTFKNPMKIVESIYIDYE